MPKPKVAFYWCASCGGCEETVVDLAEDILGVVEKVDIVLWPVAMDFKYQDVEALADQSIFATLLNGAIRSSEQEEMAVLLRRKSQYLIAYGSCAHLGGIPALANQFEREQILRFNYEESPSVVNDAKTRPQLSFEDNGRRPHLPELRQIVRALDQIVDVDFYIPGCPPTPNLTKAALDAVCLADAIAADECGLNAALVRYEQERQTFGRWVVNRGRQLGACLELGPGPQPFERDERQRAERVMREHIATTIAIHDLTIGITAKSVS